MTPRREIPGRKAATTIVVVLIVLLLALAIYGYMTGGWEECC